MSLYRRIKTVEPEKPVVRDFRTTADIGIPIAGKPHRKGAGGRKPSSDPTVVLTFRVPMSLKERLKPGWRKQVAEFLARSNG